MFKDYSSELFYPQICKHQHLYVADRKDVVFDTFKEQTLKTTTCVNRGKGVHRKVQENLVVPTNEKGFFCLDKNRTELFCFLSKTAISLGKEDKVLVCVYNDTCISSNGDSDLSNLKPYDHKEADTKVFLYMNTMTKQGHRKMVI